MQAATPKSKHFAEAIRFRPKPGPTQRTWSINSVVGAVMPAKEKLKPCGIVETRYASRRSSAAGNEMVVRRGQRVFKPPYIVGPAFVADRDDQGEERTGIENVQAQLVVEQGPQAQCCLLRANPIAPPGRAAPIAQLRRCVREDGLQRVADQRLRARRSAPRPPVSRPSPSWCSRGPRTNRPAPATASVWPAETVDRESDCCDRTGPGFRQTILSPLTLAVPPGRSAKQASCQSFPSAGTLRQFSRNLM